MAGKTDISVGRWTAFWNNLGIAVPKRQRFLNRYNPKVSDFGPLVRLGVDRNVIEDIYGKFTRYTDPLLFHKFCRFFRRDPHTVQAWSGGTDLTDAFIKLYRIFVRNSLSDLKTRFGELRLLSELNQKGEGRHYEIKYRRVGSVPQISGQKFTRRLNLYDPRARYIFENTFSYEGATIVCIKKRSQGDDVYKFVKIKRTGGKIDVWISADSKSEYNIIQFALRDYFNSYVDTPQSSASLDALRQFLQNGQSNLFRMAGVTYLHDNFRVTISPQFQQQLNITSFPSYQSYIQGKEAERVVTSLRVSSSNLSGRPPLPIDILTSANSNLIGAILLRPLDRRLNSRERGIVTQDFENDFGFELGSFISYDDLSAKDIYQRLLQTVGRRSPEVQLRSNAAVDIFKELVSGGVIEPELATQDEPLYCVNRDCRLAYATQRGRQYCSDCGEQLIPGQAVLRPSISERKTAQYVREKLESLGFETESFGKKLLKRQLNIISVMKGRSSVQIIPMTGELNPSQIDLLRLRLPNALILTSRDNLEKYTGSNIKTHHLYEFVYFLDHGTGDQITSIIEDVIASGMNRVRVCAQEASQRFRDLSYYQGKNAEVKNLGAEIFEADTHLIWSYMFRNSTWLGATQRGKPLPDGIWALPVVSEALTGCIIWDAKYSEGRINLGDHKKNLHYITSGRQNESIKQNGGLGGFIFVGTQPAPASFPKRYKKLGGVRKPKIVYITQEQLLRIYNHFIENEDIIINNSTCYGEFMKIIYNLFISTACKQKTLVVDDDSLGQELASAASAYATQQAPSVTASA